MPKQPKIAQSPSPQKQPYSQEIEVSKLKVQWCFELFDKGAKWHDGNYTEETFREIAGFLQGYSTMRWGLIEQDRTRNHEVCVVKMIKDAQKRLEEIKLDDYDRLWHFRFDGKKRLWGIRNGHVFRILWYDPQHKICPSEKK